MTGNIDYREAFVLNMEMNAHGFTCRQCQVAVIKGKLAERCERMKHIHDYIKRAYEALPPYYKQRYEAALDSTINESRTALESVGIKFHG